jgi:hypothetical protein
MSIATNKWKLWSIIIPGAFVFIILLVVWFITLGHISNQLDAWWRILQRVEDKYGT